jgi:hypothetical protein
MEKQVVYLVQIKQKEIADPRVALVNELCLSSYVGGDSLGVHVKRKARNALWCLLMGEDIHEIIVSRQALRKAAYKERREEKRRGNKGGKGDGSDDEVDAEEKSEK